MRISDWSSDVCSSDLMAALATTLLALVKPGDVIVHSSPLYAATETLIARILGRFGVKWIDFPAGASREETDSALGKAEAKGERSQERRGGEGGGRTCMFRFAAVL